MLAGRLFLRNSCAYNRMSVGSMTCFELMHTVARLRADQAFNVKKSEFFKVAGECLPALDRPARRSDVDEFIAKIEDSWGILVQETKSSFILRPFQ